MIICVIVDDRADEEDIIGVGAPMRGGAVMRRNICFATTRVPSVVSVTVQLLKLQWWTRDRFLSRLDSNGDAACELCVCVCVCSADIAASS